MTAKALAAYLHPTAMSPLVLPVVNATRAAEFYARAFGASELARKRQLDGGWVIHLALSIRGGSILLADAASTRDDNALASKVELEVEDRSIQEIWARATDAGAKILIPLERDDEGAGHVCGVLADPFGHLWSVETPREPLTTEELEAAAATSRAAWELDD
jgi:PhnB protein